MPQKRNCSTEKTENRLASRRIVLSMTYEQYKVAMSTSQNGEELSDRADKDIQNYFQRPWHRVITLSCQINCKIGTVISSF